MFYKVVDSYSHALEFVPDCYITQDTCDKALDTHSCILKKKKKKKKKKEKKKKKKKKERLKKSDKALNGFFLAFFKIFGLYNTQEMCDRIISDDSFSLTYVPDKYDSKNV